MTSNLYPDLRYLTPEKHAIFKEIVIDGAYLGLGMPKFDDALTPSDAADIQAYVLEMSKGIRTTPPES
jgi:quinohemoprotein ethanol dehydrogenase